MGIIQGQNILVGLFGAGQIIKTSKGHSARDHGVEVVVLSGQNVLKRGQCGVVVTVVEGYRSQVHPGLGEVWF